MTSNYTASFGDHPGKIVYEDSDCYIVLEQDWHKPGGLRRVRYQKNSTSNYSPDAAPVTQSYDLPTFRSAEVLASPYFTGGGGGEFSGGGASSSYDSSSSDSSSDSSSSSSD